MEILLRAQGLEKRYGSLPVLKGVSLEVKAGEVVAIVGASGAGKSTLLHILGTLDQADSGSLFLRDQNLGQLRGEALARFRNKNLGFVFQFHNLMPEFTALENVAMPGMLGNRPEKEVRQEAEALLVRLGLAERLHHKPSELSGGEQQRCAVARALINRPALVLADEPSGNLDSAHAQSLHDLFFQLRDELGQTFVIVTHNPLLAQQADRTLRMQDGYCLD